MEKREYTGIFGSRLRFTLSREKKKKKIDGMMNKLLSTFRDDF